MKKANIAVVLLFVFAAGLMMAGCEKPEVTRPCVVMLGDSIFALSDQEGKFLFDLAGDTYREYYISGAQLVGGPIKTIEEQYYDAKADDDAIRTVIMDGGGNDILIGAMAKCSTDYGTQLSDACYDVMDEVLGAAAKMFEMAVADGVKNIVFQGYYYVRNEKLWQVTDVFQEKGIQLVQELDDRYPDVKVIYIDPRPHFERGASDHLRVDGIHPTRKASKTLAKLVWDAMVANGIEPPGQSCN